MRPQAASVGGLFKLLVWRPLCLRAHSLKVHAPLSRARVAYSSFGFYFFFFCDLCACARILSLSRARERCGLFERDFQLSLARTRVTDASFGFFFPRPLCLRAHSLFISLFLATESEVRNLLASSTLDILVPEAQSKTFRA